MLDDYIRESSNKESGGAAPCKPAFGYYGAKQRISRSIIDMFPPHNAWVEVFCGSAAITLAKEPAKIEVINDLDSNIINVFKQMRDNHDELIRVIELTPYSREEFVNSKIIDEGEDDLERARKFIVNCMMTVNATLEKKNCGFSFSNSYTRDNKEARVCRWNNVPERISKVIDRISNTRVEQMDARELIKGFSDRPATLMYLDPPYFVDRSHGYPIDQRDKEFHEEMLSLCTESKAMILISNYDNKLYRKMLNRKTGWHSKTIKTKTRDTTGKDYSRNEIVWMNETFVKAKKANKVPIRLSSKEKQYKKVNPPR